MTLYVLYGVAGLLLVVAVLQLLLLLRSDKPLRQAFASFEESSAKGEQELRGEFARILAEAREFREDVSAKFTALMKLMVPASTVTRSIDEKLDRVREAVEQKLQAMQDESSLKLDKAGENTLAVANGQRQDSAAAIEKAKQAIISLLDQYTQYQNKMLNDSLANHVKEHKADVSAVIQQLGRMVETAEQKLNAYRAEVDARLKRIQAEVAVVNKFSSATRMYGAALATEFDGTGEPRPAADGNANAKPMPSR